MIADARPGQHQGGVGDQAAAAVVGGAGEAAGEGGVDLGGRERADRDRDEAVAEIAVGIEVAGGAALMAGLSQSTALAISVAATSAVAASAASTVTEIGDAEREGAPARARRGDAADAGARRRGGCVPFSAGTAPRENSPATPMSSVWPVTRTAMSPPSLT